MIRPLAKMLELHRRRSGNPKFGAMFRNRRSPLCLNNLANRVIAPSLQWCRVCGVRRIEHRKAEHPFQLDPTRTAWRGRHAFRRGLATNLYRLGVPEKTIQAILRHANVSTTNTYYIKSVPEDSVKAMKALEKAAVSLIVRQQSTRHRRKRR